MARVSGVWPQGVRARVSPRRGALGIGSVVEGNEGVKTSVPRDGLELDASVSQTRCKVGPGDGAMLCGKRI